jgi:nucleoside-diphosphate-sugar epimerase
MKVLVTGAAGFIGAHVVRQLTARGHETFAAVRPGSGAWRLDGVRDACTVVDLELDGGVQTRSVLGEIAPDAVIHLAWYAEPGRYRHAVAENVASLGASAALLLAAADAGCRRVVLGGTCLEHAVTPTRPIYDAAKVAVHRLSEGFADTGLNVACGHVFYLYGPLEDERRVIPSVIRALLAGESIATTTGHQRRDYLYVADVAAAFAMLAETTLTGGVDICSGSLVTLADVLRTVALETGRPDLLRLGDLGPADDDGYALAGDPGLLLSVGWRPQYDLRTGLRETIAGWSARQEART